MSSVSRTTKAFGKRAALQKASLRPDDPMPLLEYLADLGYSPKFIYKIFNTMTNTGYYCFYIDVNGKKLEAKSSKALQEAMNKLIEKLEQELNKQATGSRK